ncbi:MAG: hypothetical protein ABW219_17935, partial [Ilumatobacteraceae bacterium]
MAQDVTTATVRLVGTQAIYTTNILDRLVRDFAAGPVMLDAAGRLSLGLELQGFVAPSSETQDHPGSGRATAPGDVV